MKKTEVNRFMESQSQFDSLFKRVYPKLLHVAL